MWQYLKVALGLYVWSGFGKTNIAYLQAYSVDTVVNLYFSQFPKTDKQVLHFTVSKYSYEFSFLRVFEGIKHGTGEL